MTKFAKMLEVQERGAVHLGHAVQREGGRGHGVCVWGGGGCALFSLVFC